MIERAAGSVLIVATTARAVLGRVTGLGDLSHASAVFSRDERHAFVFGRDGGLSKIDLLEMRLAHRIVQAGNAIGGAISDDGRLVAVSNYDPGGTKIFDAETLDLLADIPAECGLAKPSKTVGLVDAPGRRFITTLYDGSEIWIIDCAANPRVPAVTRFGPLASCPTTAPSRAMGAITSPACSARTASCIWTSGPSRPRRGASSTATGAASSRSPSTRCRISKAGR